MAGFKKVNIYITEKYTMKKQIIATVILATMACAAYAQPVAIAPKKKDSDKSASNFSLFWTGGREGHMMALGNLYGTSKNKVDDTAAKIAAAKKKTGQISPEKKALMDSLIAAKGRGLIEAIKNNTISSYDEVSYIIREIDKKSAAATYCTSGSR